MNVLGMTKYDVIVSVVGARVPVQINLGRMVVIQNLGVDALLGQPAKIDNEVVTFPHKQLIQFKDVHGIEHKVSYPLKNDDRLNLHEVVNMIFIKNKYQKRIITFEEINNSMHTLFKK